MSTTAMNRAFSAHGLEMFGCPGALPQAADEGAPLALNRCLFGSAIVLETPFLWRSETEFRAQVRSKTEFGNEGKGTRTPNSVKTLGYSR
jgi:hypothetical protein